MFADRSATAMLPATDVDRARQWYESKLGLRPADVRDVGNVYELHGGMRMFLYRSDHAGTARHTLISFSCNDLRSDMAELRSRGVEFLDYDLPQLKTVDGVADFGSVKSAWAKDSEGNILAFVQGL